MVPARRFALPPHRNTALYSEREMRDLWHDPLSPPEAERELLVAHPFEVTDRAIAVGFSEECQGRAEEDVLGQGWRR